VGAVVLGQFDAARTIYGVDHVAEQVEAQVVIANGLEVMSDRLRRERDQGRAEGAARAVRCSSGASSSIVQ